MRAALALAALLLTCCDSTVEGRVCGFGDSILAQAGEEMTFALGYGRFVPDGTLGVGLDGLPDFLARSRSDVYAPIAVMVGARLDAATLTDWYVGRRQTAGIGCSQVVASWGTNDAGGTIGGFESVEHDLPIPARIDAFMQAMQGAQVLWIVPNTHAAPAGRIEAWQAALADATLRWPKLLLFWGDPAWIGPDRVHYTEAGQTLLANAVADHLQEMAQ